ncbi:MAG: hypothetical protein KatS3mg104_2082 [Phycisphaerae bacterium]|nr:MAG: hypothetical protein KatS3mg104_2082 [Phycisphaerae bacterium]
MVVSRRNERGQTCQFVISALFKDFKGPDGFILDAADINQFVPQPQRDGPNIIQPVSENDPSPQTVVLIHLTDPRTKVQIPRKNCRVGRESTVRQTGYWRWWWWYRVRN